jgi:hypothetical protein
MKDKKICKNTLRLSATPIGVEFQARNFAARDVTVVLFYGGGGRGLFPTEQPTRSPLGIVSLDRIDETKRDDNAPIQMQP